MAGPSIVKRLDEVDELIVASMSPLVVGLVAKVFCSKRFSPVFIIFLMFLILYFRKYNIILAVGFEPDFFHLGSLPDASLGFEESFVRCRLDPWKLQYQESIHFRLISTYSLLETRKSEISGMV